MNENTSYGLVVDDDPESSEADYSESRVVNITDEVVSFTVATTPGSPPRKYRLAPFGRDGSGVSLQSGYCKPYKGAGGTHLLEPIIERKTKRHAWPAIKVRKEDGTEVTVEAPRLPMVVREDRAEGARAAWLNAMERRPQCTGNTMRETVARMVAPAHPQPIAKAAPSSAPVPSKFIGEEVGVDEIESPPPDPDDPIDLPVVGDDAGDPPPDVPTRAKRGGRG